MFKVILVAVLVAVVTAGGCDNDCSGHGTCQNNGVCKCYDNWGMGMGLDSGDCSQRICPFEFAWVDTPDKTGNFHKYAECSNRGICDRDSGECECFPGYEGKGCARTTCPNDCSGHGRCKNIEDLPFGSTPKQFDSRSFFEQKPYTFGDAYKNWDAQKTRGCICDPEWGDVDCSKRMCMYGNDIMDQRDNLDIAQKIHTQHIQFVGDWHRTQNYKLGAALDANKLPDTGNFDDGRAALSQKTFALTFTSKLNETFTTIPIVMPNTFSYAEMKTFFKHVEGALEGLPNGVIDNVKVNGDLRITDTPWSYGLRASGLAPEIQLSSVDNTGSTAVAATYSDISPSATSGNGVIAQTKATIVIASVGVASITITKAGSGYAVGDTVTFQDTDLGGTGANGLVITLTAADIASTEESLLIGDSSGQLSNTGLDGGESDPDSLYINITFIGNNVQGPQNPLTVKHIFCGDGCTPKLSGLDLRYNTMNTTEIMFGTANSSDADHWTSSDYNSYECGRRGKCDYKSGICSCFSGYSGLSCGTITSLV